MRKYRHILADIDWFYELSTVLQQKRRQRGAIDFDLPEPNVIVDANGKAIDIEIRGSDKATSLIEELMIVCNETVSEYFSKKGVPLLYRIHEKPPEEKMDELFQFMEAIHYPLESKEATPKMWQTVLEQAKKRDEYEQVRHVLLRTLSKEAATALKRKPVSAWQRLLQPLYSHAVILTCKSALSKNPSTSG